MSEVKLCGMRSLEHARSGLDAGADYLGFVFADVRRRVEPDTAREIVSRLGRGSARYVGVFVDPDPAEANRIARYVGLDMVQLSGNESLDVVRAIELPVIKAVHVRPERDPRSEIEEYAEIAAMVLLDTHSSGLHGGTGRVFDWNVAATVAREYPVMLAGGLTAENVREAIDVVHPKAVDVSSGIETNGEKDSRKIAAFVRSVREVRV